jgi:hypothetical protein
VNRLLPFLGFLAIVSATLPRDPIGIGSTATIGDLDDDDGDGGASGLDAPPVLPVAPVTLPPRHRCEVAYQAPISSAAPTAARPPLAAAPKTSPPRSR